MSGLVALNDTVITATSHVHGAKRIIGVNNQSISNLTAIPTQGGFGALTADSIIDCYALSSMVVGQVGSAAAITSSNALDYQGADVTSADLTKAFYTGIGWKFGDSAAAPWQWVENSNPMLWYELKVLTVSLDTESITLFEDSTYTLTATIWPSTATNKNIIWMSADPTIAEVSTTGKVTAKSKGTTTIYAITEEGEKEASCEVRVERHTYTITATCGAQGTITPQGVITLEKGMDTTFTFAANNPALYEVIEVLIDGENDSDATVSGTYTFTNVTASHTIEIVVSLKTLIQKLDDENVLSIYPNPVKDMMHIQTEQIIKQIEVLDLQGKRVMQVQGDQHTVNMQSIPAGNYIVKIYTGNTILPIKIVKQ